METRQGSRAWLWGEEINVLENLGCKVEKYETLIWDERIKPFEVMHLYKDIRRREKEAGRDGGVIDNMAKLLSKPSQADIPARHPRRMDHNIHPL
jgi:hypothetical protein